MRVQFHTVIYRGYCRGYSRGYSGAIEGLPRGYGSISKKTMRMQTWEHFVLNCGRRV